MSSRRPAKLIHALEWLEAHTERIHLHARTGKKANIMTDQMNLIFLGTGAAAPSLSRGLPALVVQQENRLVLCDCGEGTQMQLQRAGLSSAKIHTILISHLHGDHLFGLPGLINSQQLLGRSRPLNIYGPIGLRRFIGCMKQLSAYEPDFALAIHELDECDEQHFDIPGFTVTARRLEHSSPCFGFRLQEPSKPGVFDADKAERLGIPRGMERAALQRGENVRVNGREIAAPEIVGPERPGRVIVYCTDTRPCEAGIELARHCDLLVHDATFSDAYADRAEPTMHSTGRDAARVAQTAGAKRLALWHLSIRLHGGEEENLLHQAREGFADAFLPSDLDVVKIERRGADEP